MAERVRGLDRRVPPRGEALRSLRVGGVGAPAVERAAQRLEADARVGEQRHARVLGRVDRRDVEVDEAHVRVGEDAARRGGEVAPARADAEHDVGLAGDRVGGGCAGGADRAERLRVVVGQRALAGLRLGHRHAGRLGERAQRVGRLGVDRPATRRRSAGACAERSSAAASASRSGSAGGRRTCQTRRAKNSSGQSNASACTSWGSESVTVPVSAGSVSTRIAASADDSSCSGRLMRSQKRDTGLKQSFTETSSEVGSSSSCEHRAGDAGGEDVARQQQHRQAVDRRERRARDHVGRARPDRGGAGVGGQPVLLAREAGRGVDHRLLVARKHVGHLVALLEQRLADARHVAVPEDAEAAGDQALLDAVALGVLVAQEPDERLGDRQPHEPDPVIGSRGSTSWPVQVSRIHAWAGSSVKRHARSPGPAITLR